MSVPTTSLRNVAIAGHGGTGKTSLVEQMLAAGGTIAKAERVETGRTVSDFTEEEIARKISIHASLCHLSWKDRKFNLLDTPGSADFVGEVIAALRAAECAMLVVGADVGVQIETIKLWRRLGRTEMPRFVFVNKMEKERADFDRTVADLKERFKAAFVPVTIPLGAGAEFKGVVDLVDGRAYLDAGPVPVPDAAKDEVEAARAALMEAAAEGDDKLIEKFFAEGTLAPEEIRRGLAQGMRAGKLVPVLCGAGLTGSGVTCLLDFIAWGCPSPEGVAKGLSADGAEVVRMVAEGEPASLFVYKTALDQFTGKISYFKVMSGRVSADSELLNAREGRREKFSKLHTCQGKKIEETADLAAGDLGLFTKSATLRTNDSLHSTDALVRWPDLELPTPVHSLAIAAKAKKDEDKINQTLQRTTEEDLTFRIVFE